MDQDTVAQIAFGVVATVLACIAIYLTYHYGKGMSRDFTRRSSKRIADKYSRIATIASLLRWVNGASQQRHIS